MGLVQNRVEAAGIATVSLSLVPYLSFSVGVPRALYVRFPYGNPYGEPSAATMQRAILQYALRWLHEADGPNLMRRIPVSWRRRARGSVG